MRFSASPSATAPATRTSPAWVSTPSSSSLDGDLAGLVVAEHRRREREGVASGLADQAAQGEAGQVGLAEPAARSWRTSRWRGRGGRGGPCAWRASRPRRSAVAGRGAVGGDVAAVGGPDSARGVPARVGAHLVTVHALAPRRAADHHGVARLAGVGLAAVRVEQFAQPLRPVRGGVVVGEHRRVLGRGPCSTACS